jgi:DNA polymerase (family 10)
MDRKVMTNSEIAELLRDVAAAYQLKDDKKNKFKIIAYQRAADAVEHASSELKDLWDDGKLDEVPGIGKSIAEHLGELFEKGKSKHFEEVMRGLPPVMFELMEIPGIGAKRAFRLTTELNIKSVAGLEEAINENRVSKLEGFGEDSQAEILRSIADAKARSKEKRHLLPYAESIANEIIDWLKKNKNVLEAHPLGSLRRRAATVGDIDIAVSTNKPVEVLEHFSQFPNKTRVLEKGTRTASLILPAGVQVDLMVETPEAYGALLQHFTGSKHHNVALRTFALKKGLSLSDYGIKKVGDKDYMKISDEKTFYAHLGMDYIPPEMREGNGEIQAALAHNLPELVDLKDIKGDLQIHSSYDIETSHDLGQSTFSEVIEKANSLKYEYIAFTEHNPSKSKHNSTQIVDILKKKRHEIDTVNESLTKSTQKSVKRVFNSLEIDILPDGGLPVPQEGMETLDFALVSIHGSFRQSKDDMTNRVLSALSNPKVKIFAHPTTRKINFREGVEIDWPKVFEFCLKNNKWIEINADPMRLDLPDVLVREAVKLGVKLTLGTDSHHMDSMENMKYGVWVARRGWAEKKDIINTRSLDEFEKLL